MIMVAPLFGPLLRRTHWANVEFSVGDALGSHSTMVPASTALLGDLAEWVAAYPFTEAWFVAVQRLTAQVAPDAALFRIDWVGADPDALTWYLRFPEPPDQAMFQGAMLHARPWRWIGPDPGGVAGALGLPGPRGVALRVDSTGRARTAIYYRIWSTVGGPAQPAPGRLFDACGLSAGIAEQVAADLGVLGTSGEVEVIGLDQGEEEETVGALKLDPGDVPVPVALGLLASKGVSGGARSRVERLATSLRARALSYLGLKYTAAGFAGWRAYFSSEPARLPRAGTVSIAARAPGADRSRLPQY